MRALRPWPCWFMLAGMKPLFVLFAAAVAAVVAHAEPWVVYQPPADHANGKHIVMLSGDEEYRSSSCSG